MGEAGRLPGNRSEAEALSGIEAGGPQPPIVEGEGLGLPVLQVELAIIAAPDRIIHQPLDALSVEPGTIEKDFIGRKGHGASSEMAADGWGCWLCSI